MKRFSVFVFLCLFLTLKLFCQEDIEGIMKEIYIYQEKKDYEKVKKVISKCNKALRIKALSDHRKASVMLILDKSYESIKNFSLAYEIFKEIEKNLKI